jgi:hypothetical protein
MASAPLELPPLTCKSACAFAGSALNIYCKAISACLA